MRTLLLLTIGLLFSGCAGEEEPPAPPPAARAPLPASLADTPELPPPSTLAEATRQFEDPRWRRVDVAGIPEVATGFEVTRYHEGRRADLVTQSGIYVIYKEYCRDESVQDGLGSGTLSSLEGTNLPVYVFESIFARSMAREHFEDLVGFAGGRLFRIHAWARIAGPTESPGAVAVRVAELACTTLEARRKAGK